MNSKSSSYVLIFSKYAIWNLAISKNFGNKIEGCGQKNLAATAKSVKNGAKHRTKYIKNILGQPEQLGQEEPSRNIKVHTFQD